MNGPVVVGFAAAAATGTLVRYLIALRANRPQAPWGTLVVNLAGSFLLGLLHGRAPTVVTVVGVGALGSLTTWSTVAVESLGLAADRRPARTMAYLGATLVGGVGAAWLGLTLG